jgi:hypothetical protein
VLPLFILFFRPPAPLFFWFVFVLCFPLSLSFCTKGLKRANDATILPPSFFGVLGFRRSGRRRRRRRLYEYIYIYIYIYVLVYVYIIYVIYLYTIESYLSPLVHQCESYNKLYSRGCSTSHLQYGRLRQQLLQPPRRQ